MPRMLPAEETPPIPRTVRARADLQEQARRPEGHSRVRAARSLLTRAEAAEARARVIPAETDRLRQEEVTARREQGQVRPSGREAAPLLQDRPRREPEDRKLLEEVLLPGRPPMPGRASETRTLTSRGIPEEETTATSRRISIIVSTRMTESSHPERRRIRTEPELSTSRRWSRRRRRSRSRRSLFLMF